MYSQAQQSSINPAFATHAAQQLREATDDLHRVFDNLREIAKGDDPKANGYDRLRATRILYDRGFGKVSKNTPHTPAPGSSRPSKSEESDNHTNHSSDNPGPEQSAGAAGAPPEPDQEPRPAASDRLVARIEQKLDDALGPPQTPDEPEESTRDIPTPSAIAPGFVPDLVRDSQHYVLEITNYGAELRSILMSIHEPDPEDTSIRACHRITAGQMIIDRVLGPAASIEQALDNPYDPGEDPYWALRNPADVDSEATIEELIEADRLSRNFVQGMRQGDGDAPCEDCEDDYLCEYHDPDGALHEYTNVTEDDIQILARAMKSMAFNRDRLYIDPQDGRLKVRPETTSTTPNPQTTQETDQCHTPSITSTSAPQTRPRRRRGTQSTSAPASSSSVR